MNQETKLPYANTDSSLHCNLYVSDDCTYQDHDRCNDSRCACPCPRHSVVQLKLEHPGLRSLVEAQSEESEAA